MKPPEINVLHRYARIVTSTVVLATAILKSRHPSLHCAGGRVVSSYESTIFKCDELTTVIIETQAGTYVLVDT